MEVTAPSKTSPSSNPEPFSRTSTKDPLISVIIPVYNVAKLLERCIDSVLTQTYQNLEIILVDDGSTDMSGHFCDVYAKRDSRIRVIHQSNRGLSGARNSGLKIATGAYVTFIDSDDFVHPDLIETLFRLCFNSNTKMSICDFLELQQGATQNTPPKSSPKHSSTIFNAVDTLTRMLCEDGFSMSAWGKLYARELFDTVTFPEGKLYEDVGTTYKLVLQCPSIAITPVRLYNYCINPGSITQQSFSLRKLDLIDLTDQMCNDLIQWGIAQDSNTKLQLQNLTQKRRMHARFSILRQMVMINPASLQSSNLDRKSFYAARRQVVKYLRHHRSYICKNPLATRRDRLALLSLQLGLPVFRLSWYLYQSQRASTQS